MTTSSVASASVPDQLQMLEGILEWRQQAEHWLDVYETVCARILAGDSPFPNMTKSGERYWIQDRDRLREVVDLIKDLI